jgi:DNA modification methylase
MGSSERIGDMNKFYHGDCLFVMNHDIEPESVDLIYLDPPFFTGKVQKGTAKWTPESMEVSYEDSKKFWGETDKIKNMREKSPEWMAHIALQRPDFASYLYYMMERLIACHKVLKPTGSIYLHCDEKASHYLKMIMDEIFGYNNFKNELIWCYKGGNATTKFRKKHDIILFYTKSSQYYFNADETRRPYSQKILSIAKKDTKGNLYYETGQNEEGKVYLHPKGQLPYDWWDDIPSSTSSHGKDHVGYPTQKPVLLLERIIKASSNEGDLILDPFCGCGTAIVTAQKLNRNWIGIDISKDAYEISAVRQGELPLEFTHFEYIKRTIDNIKLLNPQEFEKWVNEYYKATKPSPDKGIDGIMQDGTPIQTKTFLVKYPTLSELITNAKLHPSVPKPLKKVTVVSQVGFHESATKRQFEIEKSEGIKVELHTPEDMLKL